MVNRTHYPALPLQGSLDLHGLHVKEARETVMNFMKTAQEENYSSIKFITGIGNHVNSNGTRGVLHKLLPKWLERSEIQAVIKEVHKDMGAYEITIKNEKEEANLESARKVHQKLAPILFPPKELESIRKKAAEGSPHHQYLLGSLMLDGNLIKEGEVGEGLKLMEAAGNGGDSYAQMQLGFLYSGCLGVPQDYKKSRYWHEKAAENNEQIESLFALGIYYWHGHGVVRNDKIGVDYFKRAADLGDPLASHNLGKIYLEGEGEIERNGKLAQKYLEIGALGGVLDAKVLLAKQYFFGWGDVPCNYPKALYWFNEAAKDDNSMAEYYLGRIFAEGLGTSPNLEIAFNWFQKSADHGDKDAQSMVARALIEGIGTKRNVPTGLEKLKGLALAGHLQSAATLGILYLHSRGANLPKDYEKALHYLRIAANGGYLEGQKILSQILLSQKGPLDNQKEGEKWLKQAADQEDPESLFILAIRLELSDDPTKYKEEILDYYTRSAKKKFPSALYILGLTYIEGNIVTKDEERGYSLIEEAADKGLNKAKLLFGRHLATRKDFQAQKRGVAYLASIAKHDPEAMTMLGYCYREGIGVTEDGAKAAEWFAKAANQKDPHALEVMGDISLKSGKLTEALKYYLSATEKGEISAQMKAARMQLMENNPSRDLRKAVNLLTPLAEGGNPEAEYLLGIIYRYKNCGIMNSKLAIHWLRLSLNHGFEMAGTQLADFALEKTEGSNEALDCLEIAAKAGNEIAQKHLIALAFHHGHPVLAQPLSWIEKTLNEGRLAARFTLAVTFCKTQQIERALLILPSIIASNSSDPEEIEAQALASDMMADLCPDGEQLLYKMKALEFYKKITTNENSPYRIGCLYEEIGDLKEASFWLEIASKNKNCKATFKLGTILDKRSTHEPPLKREAFAKYLEAANGGHVKAMFSVAYAYNTGEGIDFDLNEARKWYRAAAEKGHIVAKLNLALILYSDTSNEKNVEEALALFNEAAEHELVEAQFMLGILHLKKNFGRHSNQGTGLSWLQKAAAQGHEKAMSEMAFRYENGKDVDQDLSQAYRLYRAAARAGDLRAQFNLASSLLSGQTTEANTQEGISWLVKAAESGMMEAQIMLADFCLNGPFEELLNPVQGRFWMEAAFAQDPEKARKIHADYLERRTYLPPVEEDEPLTEEPPPQDVNHLEQCILL